MDITKIHGKQLKALIDGHKDGLFKEYTLIKPLKLCCGLTGFPEALEELEEGNQDVELFNALRVPKAEIGASKWCEYGIQREKVDLGKEEAMWLGEIVRPRTLQVSPRMPAFSNENSTSRPSKRRKIGEEIENSLEEVPLLPLGHESICNCSTNSHDTEANICLRATITALGHQKSFHVESFKAPFVQKGLERTPDGGLGWSKSVRQDVQKWINLACTFPGAGERLSMTKEETVWLKDIVRPPKGQGLAKVRHLLAFAKPLLINFEFKLPTSAKLKPLSPILLPLSPPLPPLKKWPINNIAEPFTLLMEESCAQLLEEITTEMLATDGQSMLNPLAIENYLGPWPSTFPTEGPPANIDMPLTPLPKFQIALSDLKLEPPLSPQLSISMSHPPNQQNIIAGLHSITFTLPPPCSPDKDFIPSDDDQSLFLQQVGYGGHEFIKNLIQEQLQQDSLMLVEIPTMDDPRSPETLGKQGSHFLQQINWMGLAEKEWIGIRTLTLDLIDLKSWLIQKGCGRLPRECIGEDENLDTGLHKDEEEAMKAERLMHSGVMYAGIESETEEERLEFRQAGGKENADSSTSICNLTSKTPKHKEKLHALKLHEASVQPSMSTEQTITSVEILPRRKNNSSSMEARNTAEKNASRLPLTYFNSSAAFSATSSLNTYMAMRNINSTLLLTNQRVCNASSLQTQFFPSSSVQSTTQGTQNSVAVKDPGLVPFPPVPDFVTQPIPELSDEVGKGSCLVSTILLSKRLLFKTIKAKCPSTIRFIERDFSGKIGDDDMIAQADLMATTTSGIIFTTMQQIRQQVLLPGEKAFTASNGVRRLIEICAKKIERLWVIVAYPLLGLDQVSLDTQERQVVGMSERDYRTWKEFIEWINTVINTLNREHEKQQGCWSGTMVNIQPMLIPAPSGNAGHDVIASVTVKIMLHEKLNEYGYVVDMDEEYNQETKEEVSLRYPPAELNGYAAYCLVSLICNLSSHGNNFATGLSRMFLEMEDEKRNAMISKIVGKRMLGRVLEYLAKTWMNIEIDLDIR